MYSNQFYTDVALLFVLALLAAIVVFRWLDRPRLSRRAKERLQEIARERRESEVVTFTLAHASEHAFCAGFDAGSKYICEHLTDAQVAALRQAEWDKYDAPRKSEVGCTAACVGRPRIHGHWPAPPQKEKDGK